MCVLMCNDARRKARNPAAWLFTSRFERAGRDVVRNAPHANNQQDEVGRGQSSCLPARYLGTAFQGLLLRVHIVAHRSFLPPYPSLWVFLSAKLCTDVLQVLRTVWVSGEAGNLETRKEHPTASPSTSTPCLPTAHSLRPSFVFLASCKGTCGCALFQHILSHLSPPTTHSLLPVSRGWDCLTLPLPLPLPSHSFHSFLHIFLCLPTVWLPVLELITSHHHSTNNRNHNH